MRINNTKIIKGHSTDKDGEKSKITFWNLNMGVN